MASLNCQCTEYMQASCDMAETDYSTLFLCACIAYYLWTKLQDVEDEKPPPEEMYS